MSQETDGGPAGAGPPDAVSTPITAHGGTGRDQAVEAHAKLRSVRLFGETEGVQALERLPASESVYVDEGRLERVRSAIADGSYRIDPQQIADRMLAVDNALGR